MFESNEILKKHVIFNELEGYRKNKVIECDNSNGICKENLICEDIIQRKNHDNTIYISIEGNIGVGKTTCLHKLHEVLTKKFTNNSKFNSQFSESFDTYKIEEKVDSNWLQSFINNPDAFTFSFQIKRLMETINAVRTMATKKETMKEFGKDLHCIGDRLPLGNMSFASTHYLSGILSDEQFHLYSQTLINGGPYMYPNILFLRCSEETVLKRIQKRNRDGECKYDINYLRKLDEMNHFIFLYLWCYEVVEVIPMDWNTIDLEEINNLHRIISILKTFRWENIGKEEIKELKKYVKENLIIMSYEEMISTMDKLQEYIIT
jgi:deoxyadenosine/deoxycytidine kinase